ncbi:MAG TPA: hypothetical protein VHR45_03740 [Thermoanaerobaculia bacterium]|nr:hypothetical protein [Thermoanaerobaculia bacterium]
MAPAPVAAFAPAAAPTTAPAPAPGPWSTLLGSLKWLALSLGLSGVLVVVGFLISFAYQERLGYQFGNAGNTVFYVTEAGQFFVAVFMLAANWAVESPLVAAAAALLVLALYLAWERWSPTWPSRVNTSILAGVCVAMAIKIVALDLPTVPIARELVLGLKVSSTFADKPGVAALARGIWSEEVCSRVEPVQYGDLKQAGTVCTLSPEAYRDRGSRRFLWNISATVAICLLAVGMVASRAPGGTSRLGTVLMVPMALLILVDLLFQPYGYGKTTKSTLTDEVIVVAALESETATPRHGFLLAQDAQDLVLFDKEEKQVLIIPRSRIRYTHVEGSRDILEFYFKQNLASAHASEEQAPPG